MTIGDYLSRLKAALDSHFAWQEDLEMTLEDVGFVAGIYATHAADTRHLIPGGPEHWYAEPAGHATQPAAATSGPKRSDETVERQAFEAGWDERAGYEPEQARDLPLAWRYEAYQEWRQRAR